MQINVISGTGYGPTELAAYDAALIQTGMENRNLIPLSSIIPPAAEVVVHDSPVPGPGIWGDRIYAVLAQKRTSYHGTEVWAGIGWIEFEDGSGGLFVEHDGHSRSTVERSIRSSLTALMKNRGKEPNDSLIRMKVAGATCHDQPACALVLAVYASQDW
jgi:arginine decarboxylase